MTAGRWRGGLPDVPGPATSPSTKRHPRRARRAGLGGGCSDGGKGGLEGLRHASYVGDLDLVGFGLRGQGDGDREHTVVIDGADVVTVQAFAEEQLAAEMAQTASTWLQSSLALEQLAVCDRRASDV